MLLIVIALIVVLYLGFSGNSDDHSAIRAKYSSLLNESDIMWVKK